MTRFGRLALAGGVFVMCVIMTGGRARAEDLASFLVKPAEDAVASRRFGLAVSLWRGVAAIRGEGSDAMWKLADAWTLAGEFEAAAEELGRFAQATPDEARRAEALAKIAELEKRPKGFAGKVFEVVPADKEAKEAFRRGRLRFRAGKYADAAALYRAGVEMAPDVAGNVRELASAYEKLGRPGDAQPFFLRYLRLRPFGKNAEAVRAKLAPTGVLGRLGIVSSFPCGEVWVNRQPLGRPLPVKDLPVAPGTYRILCFNERFHFARYLNVAVGKGDSARAAFEWAILVNKLEPWGRIVMENPDRANEMNDIGVWDEIGVPVPDDRRALRVVMRAGDASRRKEVVLQLEAGKRIPLTW
ncbi:MAG TPA: tetratricopeptide repeat protein [Haliangiales bacterium]|nr:tetratricopeptide repeat protein [Haliangiales bacterium]